MAKKHNWIERGGYIYKKIGSLVRVDGSVLRATLNTDGLFTCSKCFFYGYKDEIYSCWRILCESGVRPDRADVFFQELKEV